MWIIVGAVFIRLFCLHRLINSRLFITLLSSLCCYIIFIYILFRSVLLFLSFFRCRGSFFDPLEVVCTWCGACMVTKGCYVAIYMCCLTRKITPSHRVDCCSLFTV